MNLRLLITEDDATLRRMYATVLGKLPGVDVDYASTPQDCHELLDHHQYDLALFDIDLKDPKEDGLDLLKWMRQQAPTSAVLMMSSMDDGMTVARCLDLGASGFLSKNHEFVRTLQSKVRTEVLRHVVHAS